MTKFNGVNTCLVLAFDKNYMRYAAVAVASLLDNYHYDEKLDIVCLVPEYMIGSEEDFLLTLGEFSSKAKVSFRFPEEYEKLAEARNLPELYPERFSMIAAYRLFISSVCHDFDRAIYLDCDTLTVSSISDLLMLPMYQPIHAVHEVLQVEYPEKLGLGVEPYFNDGVFVADLNWWRADGFDKKVVEIAYTIDSTETKGFDQDVLNVAFRGKWFPLSLRFNYFNAYDEWRGHFMLQNPIVVHFASDSKPWLASSPETKWKALWNLYSNRVD
jgi:lipopolysaccharide biosynthesis glycosyltransferase